MAGSDVVLLNNTGIRFINTSRKEVWIMSDRFPSSSNVGFRENVEPLESGKQALISGYQIVLHKPFALDDAMLENRKNQLLIKSPNVLKSYSNPMIPLLMLSNLSLEDRVKTFIRSCVHLSPLVPTK